MQYWTMRCHQFHSYPITSPLRQTHNWFFNKIINLKSFSQRFEYTSLLQNAIVQWKIQDLVNTKKKTYLKVSVITLEGISVQSEGYLTVESQAYSKIMSYISKLVQGFVTDLNIFLSVSPCFFNKRDISWSATLFGVKVFHKRSQTSQKFGNESYRRPFWMGCDHPGWPRRRDRTNLVPSLRYPLENNTFRCSRNELHQRRQKVLW